MSRLIVLILFSILSSALVRAQAVPSPGNLVLATPDGTGGYENKDSLCLDTSANPKELCAKRYFSVLFRTAPFHDSAAADANGNYDITDVDDTHNDYFLWKRLDSLTDGLVIHTTTTETSSEYYAKYFRVSFGKYIRVDTVLSYFAAMDSVASSDLVSRAVRYLSSSNDPAFKQVQSMTQIAGTSTTPNNERRYTLLGYQYNLHLTKIPMAWEITKGSNQVYVGVDDQNTQFGLTDVVEHRDLHKVANGGNYLFPGFKSAGVPQTWDGTTKIIPAHQNHGFANLGVIAAEENTLGLVGFAPGVRVFQTHNQDDNRYAKLDVSATSGIQLPHVMSCAYILPSGTTGTYREAMENGITVISSGPNGENKVSYEPVTTAPYILSGIDVDYNDPDFSPLGGLVLTHATDPQKDVKILAVEQYSHSLVRGGLQDCPIFNSFGYGPEWDFNQPMCLGLGKFSTASTQSTRAGDKTLAYIDVVVPANYLGLLLDGSTSKYEEYCAGNSRAVPQAAAIVGLMNSVHDRLGKTGLDVQRRVYDIVTFTADKILDLQPGHTAAQSMASESGPGNDAYSTVVPNSTSPEYRVFKVPNRAFAEQYSYLLDGSGKLKTGYIDQTNDALHRYWAPRFGFGRINAFRCVAHSIPGTNGAGQENVKYQYSGSDDLDWAKGHALSGTTYLHLGKFKDATTKVLDAGGVAYTGEPAYMNNNGKTLVDVDLSVGTSQTLVVDGILTTSLSSNFKKIATSSTGRILATGWVENVDLEGLVRASDLRIKRTAAGTALKTTGSSELHDTTWLRGSGDIVVSSGTLTLQPGATVYLYDGAKIIVKAGAELKLKHGARILDKETTKLANRIVLEQKNGATPGGKLTIESKVEEAVIDAEVQVNDDAQFTVNDAEGEAFPSVWIHKVTVETGGKVSLADKAFIKRVNPSSTTPALILKSSNGLVVAGSATVRLDAPVEVQSGSKLEVGTSATLKVGALTVQSNGSLIAKAGATVQFFDDENTIRGKFSGEGAPGNLARFKATNESSGSCSALTRKNFVRLIVEPDKWVYNTNTPGTQPLDQVLMAYFHAQDAEFTNVYTTIKNMPVLARVGGVLQAGKMKSCTFKADRSVYVAAGMEAAFRSKPLFLVSVSKDSRLFQKARQTSVGVPGAIYQQGLNLIRYLTVEGCKFHDAGGKITSTNYRGLVQSILESLGGDYPVSGLKVTSLSKITMTGSTFAFLHTGVNAENVTGHFSGNIFGGHADGIACGSATICNNTFSGCVQGVRATAGNNQVFDNTFGGTMTSTTNTLFGSGVQVDFIGSGYLQSLGGNAECRNNELENYGSGLHAVRGVLQARDRFAFLAPNQNDRGKALVNGRNEFDGPVSGGSNPYFVGLERSDIYLGDAGVVQLECGKNVFSANQQFQLQKSNNVANVVVTTNDFGVALLANIRHNANIVPQGNDLQNGEHPYGAQCEATVRERAGEFECVILPVPDPDAFTPNYNLELLHPLNVKKFGIVVPSWDGIDTNYAKEIFTVSTSWLANAGLDVAIRMESIDNAVQSAQVHPKADSVTAVLLGTLQTLGLNTGAPLVLREKAVIGRVELLSRNERYDEAQFWLDTARAGMFAGYDSVNVDLLSTRLAIMADTSLTLVQSTDTLNALVTLETEHAKRPTGMNKEPIREVVRSGVGDVLFVVYPNPSRDHLTVRYEGKRMRDVTVRLLDMMGAELLRLWRSDVTFGSEIVITDTDLPNGTYLVEVGDGTSVGTAIISVVR